MTQIFLMVGTTSFPDPGDWNANDNKVECVGGGGRGSVRYTAPLDEPTQFANIGFGGGGAAYAVGTNLAPTFPVSVTVMPQGFTNFPNNAFTLFGSPVMVSAACGANGAGQQGGGQGGTSLTPAGFPGGSGGTLGGSAGNGNGGGGAGGPNGAGANGTGNTTGSVGGAGDGGRVLGGAAGQNGSSGTNWDPSHGIGGGGGGGIEAGALPSGLGGRYGAGGGSQSATGSTAQGNGADGIMIINYTPLIAQPSTGGAFAQMMA